MTKRVIFILIFASLSLLLSSAGLPLSSQEVIIRPQKPLQHEVAVVLKLVQVYVTDRKGRAVDDLRREDFVLTEDGRPIDITVFEKRRLAAGPEAAAKASEAAAAEERAAARKTGEMSRKFFLFFDFAFNSQRGARKSKEAALHFLDAEVKPGDQVGLVSYSLTRGLSIHEFLTGDIPKVRQAVETLGLKGIAGRAEDIEQEYWRLQTESEAPPELVGGEAAEVSTGLMTAPRPASKTPIFNWRRQESKSQALNFILKLAAFARALRYVPGQKHLLLFSTGIANSLIYGSQEGNPTNNGSPRGFDAGDHILRTQNEAMLKELATSNCAMFTFDAREAAAVPTLFDYDDATFEARYRNLFTEEGVHQNTNLIFKDDRVTGRYSLERFSSITGGKYFGNIDEYKRNLDQLEKMTGTFYVLGYPVTEAWDGAYHEIKVEVKKRGLEVRAQKGYFNPRPFAETSALERQLHLLDLALSDHPLFQTPLTAAMTALACPPEWGLNLLMVSRIPAETLEKLGGDKVEIVSFVFDENDALSDMRRSVDNLARFKDRPVYYASGGNVKAGFYKCRLVVRDLATGNAAVAAARVFVPPPQTASIRLHSVLPLSPETGQVFLEGRASIVKEAGTRNLVWTTIYPFDIKRYAPAIAPLPWGTFRLYAAVPCTVMGIDEAKIALRAALVNTATGARTPLPVTLHDRVDRGETFIQFFEVSLSGTTAGSYVLYVYAEETTTGALSYATAPLALR
jgi:VWFA-related protein